MTHRTVLLQETIDGLDVREGDIVIDGTLGGSGHSEEILKRTGDNITLIAFDLDPDAIERAKKRLHTYEKNGAKIIYFNRSFRDMGNALHETGLDHADKIILDLGLSSNQLEESGRGFTFQKDEPLLMTFGQSPNSENNLTAFDVVNSFEENNLADVIYGFGGEKFSRRIARAIVEERANAPIESTARLASIVRSAVPFFYRNGKIHPATKTFQALRITVNDELKALEDGLERGFDLLAPRGRMAVISFHSLEDRLVKNFFRTKVKEAKGKLLFKRPIVPTEEEVRRNPRARSSKLRIIIKS